MNATTTRTFKRFLLVSMLALTLIGAGCASSASNSASAENSVNPPSGGFRPAALKAGDAATQVPPSAKSAESPAPRVQECGIVAISSPPKYVCNGKVYTAVQLARIRADQAQKYQSGQ